MLNMHVNDALKVAPPATLPTTGCNGTMSLRDIVDQIVTMYGKPTPDTMCQNNLTFLAAYNWQDHPEILFKQCTDCQEIATLAQKLYTTQQLLQKPWTSLDDVASTSATLRIGNESHLATKCGSIFIPSSKKHASDASHQEGSFQRKVGTSRVTALPA
jgi:hypothetical protein